MLLSINISKERQTELSLLLKSRYLTSVKYEVFDTCHAEVSFEPKYKGVGMNLEEAFCSAWSKLIDIRYFK